MTVRLPLAAPPGALPRVSPELRLPWGPRSVFFHEVPFEGAHPSDPTWQVEWARYARAKAPLWAGLERHAPHLTKHLHVEVRASDLVRHEVSRECFEDVLLDGPTIEPSTVEATLERVPEAIARWLGGWRKFRRTQSHDPVPLVIRGLMGLVIRRPILAVLVHHGRRESEWDSELRSVRDLFDLVVPGIDDTLGRELGDRLRDAT